MRTCRFLLLALLLPCAPALAEDSPCLDTSKLEVGGVYQAAGTVAFAHEPGGPVDALGFSYTEFTIVGIVHLSGIAWYQVQVDRVRWGWLDSQLLAGRTVEQVTSDPCVVDQARLCQGLDDVARAYAALGESPSVEQLIALDGRIRKLDAERSCSYFNSCPNDATTTLLGIYGGHYETFEYHGKLLGDAHRLDPNSPLRPVTLYSTVEYHGGGSEFSLPDHRAAKAYFEEFPEGPYAADVALALAEAYADAWTSMGEGGIDYCKPDDLDDLKGESPQELREYAGRMADSWFQKFFRLRKLTPDERSTYEKWREPPNTYFTCDPC